MAPDNNYPFARVPLNTNDLMIICLTWKKMFATHILEADEMSYYWKCEKFKKLSCFLW